MKKYLLYNDILIRSIGWFFRIQILLFIKTQKLEMIFKTIRQAFGRAYDPIRILIRNRDGTWSDMYELGQNKFVKSSYVWIVLVPILYKLFSKMQTPESGSVIKVFDHEFILNFELPFTLLYFYFGALFIFLANFLYKIYCPKILQENKDYGMFENARKSNQTLKNYASEINLDLGSEQLPRMIVEEASIGSQPAQMTLNEIYHAKRNQVFNQIYEKANVSRKYSRNAVARYYTLGLLLIGIVLFQNLLYMLKVLIDKISCIWDTLV